MSVMVTVANPDAKRLYDDLLSNYNKLVRPVANVSDALTVKIKLKLSQLIDVVTTSTFSSVIFPAIPFVCSSWLANQNLEKIK